MKMSSNIPSLPYELAVGKFLDSRIKEISGLASVLETPPYQKLASQQVPKHMRRRAVSHNPKRLPRQHRLRQISQRDKSGGNVPPSKRPNRKFRRRPKNLLLEYNRRQKTTSWLETHIWHAKRFHMEKRFGYSLAHHPNDKCWRACYRATTSKCLIRDVSYFSAIQLVGNENVIVEKLAELTEDATCKVFRKGSEVEAEAMLYKPGKYPNGAIGKVSYLWKPQQDQLCKVMWIWIPGEIYQETLEVIKCVFEVDDKRGCNELSAKNEDDKRGCNELSAKNEDDERGCNELSAKNEDGETERNNLMGRSEDSVRECNQPSAKKLKLEQINEGPLDRDVEGVDIVDWIQNGDAFKEKEPKVSKPVKNVNLTKLETKNVPYERTPKYRSDCGVDITLLKDTLNRFRLTGPLSTEIMAHCLKPANVDIRNVSDLIEEDKDLQWWMEYYKDEKRQEEFKKQVEIWEGIKGKGPGELPEGMLLGLTVKDPRLILPKKRNQVPNYNDTKHEDSGKETGIKNSENGDKLDSDEKLTTDIMKTTDMSQSSETPPWSSSATPLWSPTVRDSVSLSKCPDHVINKIRGSALVPGTPLDLGAKESRVPVLLIQRPGQVESGKNAWGFGWDVVVPAGWGMSFWMCLVYCGARVGGINEEEHFYLEQGKFPCCQDDSAAGQKEMERRGEVLKESHFKLPPAKRVNFAKVGTASPFGRPWAILIADWINTGLALNSTPVSSNSLNWCVMRNRKILSDLGNGKIDSFLSDEVIIPVKIKLIGKGTLSSNAIICIPNDSDLEMLKEDNGWGGPLEVLQEDQQGEERNQTRKKHQALKKQLKRRWKKVKNKKVQMLTQAAANIDIDEEKLKLAENGVTVLKKLRDNENLEYKNKTDKLWVGDFNSVKNSCSRNVAGFLCDGGYSYRSGGVVGVGYVVWKAWTDCSKNKWSGLVKPHLVGDAHSKKNRLLVLVKETSSLQYRFATMDVMIDL